MAKEKNQVELAEGISRRDFARSAALAAATVAVLPGNLLATPDAAAAAPSVSPSLPPDQPKLSPESQAEVDAKIQAIFRKFGERFSEEQKADVRRLMTEGQKSFESLRAFPLDNANQPATVLKVYPDPGAGPRRSPKAPGATH